jgi:hypothetical protein
MLSALGAGRLITPGAKRTGIPGVGDGISGVGRTGIPGVCRIGIPGVCRTGTPGVCPPGTWTTNRTLAAI